jgi:hypothetical protein
MELLLLLALGRALVQGVNRAPTWGQEVLAFLRDLRDYRRGR